ncbi:MAG TPA: sigma 54-interacting transcriptional regulator, partial [Gammaproteobacteria bacterium]|nr:sigma 54-interacting transcriptional regulator [Gammaproteobacteria bacterium]
TQKDLDLAYDELKALLDINQAATRHLNRSSLFAELARSVKPLLAAERFGVEVPTGPESLRVHVLALDQPSRGPMIEDFPSAGTACRWAAENRQWYVANSRVELHERFPMTFSIMQREGMESLCALPLLREDNCFGALFFMSTQRDAYHHIPMNLLERVGSAIAVAFDNCLAYEEVAALNTKLSAENVYLQEEIRSSHNFDEIVGESAAIGDVLSLVDTVAPTHSTVLILGETGTGKELIARAIHDRSPRRAHPLVKVNCAAISAGLVESELFGHVRGAFTGASTARMGRFEVANGGTIFLDEIGELPLETQVKLLRVLQEREIEPVGSNQTKKVDVRVIAATNRDLEQDVAAGRFRADLLYRLNIVPIVVPPLRERPGDVEVLAQFFARRHAREIGKAIEGIARPDLERLRAYDWPGNVRELSNIIERAVVLASGPLLRIDAELLPMPAYSGTDGAEPAVSGRPVPAERDSQGSLSAVQREHILNVLERAQWVIEGPT